MRIHVDFDDCLCETAMAFSKLALENPAQEKTEAAGAAV